MTNIKSKSKNKKSKKDKNSSLLNRIKNYNYKKGFKNFRVNFVNFVKYNIQFMSFVILSLISCIILRKLTINVLWDFWGSFFDLSVLILLGSLAYFIKPRKQYWYFSIVMFVITLVNIINTIYYAFFNSFVSAALLATLGQASEQGGAVLEKLKPIYFIYLLMPVIFFIINRVLKSKDYFNVVEKIEQGKKLFVGCAIVGGICLLFNISTLESKDLSRFSKQWNREYIVQRFGIIIYQGNDLVQTISSKLNSIFGYEEAAQNFATYYTENPYKESNNKYTGKYKGYNVVVVHMESIMQFLIDLKINGQEVTPNLNKLVKESMYFNNYYAQVSVGTSSDTEFTFNTSLMPVQSGTVFVSYYNRNYVTLEKLLAEKGYYTFSMHGNKASMWNRANMHKSMGYKDFYSQEYYDLDEIVGLGLSDHSFFRQAMQIINKINTDVKSSDEYNNWMGTIITLSNHTPFDIENYKDKESLFDVTYHTGLKDEDGNEIIYDYLEGETIGDYIKSAHYADECLGEFIDYVKSSSDFDKTLFVMYGDHAAQLSRSQFGYFVNYDFNTGEEKSEDDPTYVNYDYIENELFKKVPLIIWSKDKKFTGTFDYPMGMIDALPTISNMLGIKNPYALGHDIFDIKYDNTVVFANGNFLTNKMYYNNSKSEYRILDVDSTIDENYVDEKKKYTENILDLSNDIIVYDLIETASDRIGATSNEEN